MDTFKQTAKVASKNKRNASIVKFLGACIFVCVVFCAGFAVRGNTDLLNAMGLSSFDADSDVNPGMTVSGDTYNSLSARFAEVDGILSEGGMESYDLSQATAKALPAFLGTVDDPYLRYYDDQSYQSYLATTKNPNAGIGVLFGESNGQCFVSDVFEDSAAASAGIQSGDRIVSIDGIAKTTWSAPDVLNALSRGEGESVFIIWNRPATESSEESTFGTTLTFSSSSEENVTYEMQEGIGIIRLKQITSDSASQVTNAINAVTAEGAHSLVLDLRDVPGGYLTQAVDISSLFIQSGVVVQIETAEGTTSRSADGKSITTAPLVVLVNGRTSGCAEVLAAALQETDRASVVGTVTLGKGSVQIMQPLSFGGALRYTAAYYLTPNGRLIEGTGVSPDIESSSASTQESVALDMARSLAR
ncbi:MAG: S41 family peptidase [Eggerthellaceae bacterium]